MTTLRTLASPGRRSARDPSRTREALLAAGTGLFAERGYSAATVDAIARQAGVNKAMINYHFGGKLGLYRAILTDTLTVVGDRAGRLAGSRLGADERLRAFVQIFAEMARERPQFPAMVLREVLSGAHRMDERVLALIASLAGIVGEIVRQGIEDGTFRPVDPFLTHLSLAGSLIFFFATASFRERAAAQANLPEARADDYVRHVQELVTRGLAREGGRTGDV